MGSIPYPIPQELRDARGWLKRGKELDKLVSNHLNAAHAHVARCICRRAERMVVTLDELEGVESLVLMYLNRLSDYLFVLSRKMSQDKGATEHTWTPRN